jgi:hypothetical protein
MIDVSVGDYNAIYVARGKREILHISVIAALVHTAVHKRALSADLNSVATPRHLSVRAVKHEFHIRPPI